MCRGCKEDILSIFFDFDEFTHKYMYLGIAAIPSNYVPLCLGCKLTIYLNEEKDHHKWFKVDMVKNWLKRKGGLLNDDNILEALRSKAMKRGMNAAKYYDVQRKAYEADEKTKGPWKQRKLQ
jgi:hypothetical protein